MDEAVELTDQFTVKAHRKVYTFNELGIPGLAMLGWHHSRKVRGPLIKHYHRDRIEITLVLQGNIFMSVEGKGYNLCGGDVFVTPANLTHDTGTFPMGICEMYWMQLHISESSFLYLKEEWSGFLQGSLRDMQTGIFKGVKFSRKYLADMFSLITSNSQGDKYQGTSLLVNLAHGIAKACPEAQSHLSADIQRAIDYIAVNICENIQLEELASASFLSLPRFKQKFQEQIGMSPRMYINSKKIELSRELLSSGKSVIDTAFDLGFNSSTYFSTVFRKFSMASPSEFLLAQKSK